ncbi:hypothetical protein AWZ03_001587 [Drosophila navojoa]|uniref:Uncharacterized protein n=2 Tax=Drosophila navojoa TaxID=7232 RepID=A0A484BT06_DRONA|nr:hypothetical protein AWZ03_001587 [Drosophila navojoa]
MDSLCRVCMDDSVTLVDIFTERQQPSTEQPSLCEILNEFCEVKPDDFLPHQICLSCVLAAQNAYKFKRTFEETERKLLLLQNIKICEGDNTALPCVQAVYDKDGQAVNLSCVKLEPLNGNEDAAQEDDLEEDDENEEAGENEAGYGRPYKCQFCEKSFARNYLLSVHEM